MAWYHLKWEEYGENQENHTFNEARVYIEKNEIQIYLLRFSRDKEDLENKEYCTAAIDIKYHTKAPHFTYRDQFGQEIEIDYVAPLKF